MLFQKYVAISDMSARVVATLASDIRFPAGLGISASVQVERYVGRMRDSM